MFSRFRRALAALAAAVLITISLAYPVDAHHMVLRFNLEEMTTTADRVFLGRCIGVETTREMIAQGLLPVTQYTFEIERVIKGRLPRRITIRQLGHPAVRTSGKDREVTMHGRAITADNLIHGMSVYRTGDRVVLFLIPDYLGGKVTYPVGLYQGAFTVSRMPSGQDLVRNSINNLDLFTARYNGTTMKAADARIIYPDRENTLESQGLSAQSQSLTRKRGALPLEPFLELIEKINAAHGNKKGELVEGGNTGRLQ